MRGRLLRSAHDAHRGPKPSLDRLQSGPCVQQRGKRVALKSMQILWKTREHGEGARARQPKLCGMRGSDTVRSANTQLNGRPPFTSWL